jgi:hypothetical protein
LYHLHVDYSFIEELRAMTCAVATLLVVLAAEEEEGRRRTNNYTSLGTELLYY